LPDPLTARSRWSAADGAGVERAGDRARIVAAGGPTGRQKHQRPAGPGLCQL